MKLYSMIDSGNSYKVRLLLAKLVLPYEHIATSSRDGSTRTPEFLARNPIGKVPLLELDDGRFLAESNAILLYLADGSPFIPEDRYDRAKLYQWLFFEQYSHEPNVAVRRALKTYPERAEQATPERLAQTLAGGNHALSVMEQQLKKTPFLVGHALTAADISLYAYTHDAEVGGFNLGDYPAVTAWLERVAAEPRHVPMRDPRILAADRVRIS
ncbi:glutathione S-transferase [Nitratireductor aestuarii]|uniref:Glutathione S-transferase n=1 Tax=Nitratireductor aestuarii TaxID=1735103 RepID=A0A916RUZ8_9HYPH|nr:glutathione S-transferase family protein [Nitratireductor aestuarii]GGA70386.1 glutathione S-transferase [Nitratireductor aestuarii]